MKRAAIYATCLSLILALPVGALAAEKAANPDQRFLQKAAEDNLAEVQLGKLARSAGRPSRPPSASPTTSPSPAR